MKFTLFLLVLNLLYFALYQSDIIKYYGVILNDNEFQIMRLITYSFTHVRIEHLILNMFMTVLLVGAHEKLLGTKQTIKVYYIASVLGVLVFVLANMDGHLHITHGASGGWWGILGSLIVNAHHINLLFSALVIIVFILCVYDTIEATKVNEITHFAGGFFGFLTGLYILYKTKRWRILWIGKHF